MSCSQSGAGGPPFSPAVQQDEASLLLRLRRWLPWQWYSVDGSGWCYNADWDRMQRCAEMDVPVDWNGVGAAPAPPWFGVEERGLLVAVLLSGAVLTCDAELTRAPRGPRRLRTGDGRRAPAFRVPCATGGAGQLASQGPTYCTHWVRVPAIRAPYVPRTVRARTVPPPGATPFGSGRRRGAPPAPPPQRCASGSTLRTRCRGRGSRARSSPPPARSAGCSSASWRRSRCRRSV